MTEQRKNRQALRALSAERHDYAVGYGKPPAAHRFRKGQSGNPKGRPRGARNKQPALSGERLTAIILDEAYRGIDIRDGDRRLTVPMAQAVMRSIAHNAVKGRHFSQKLFAGFCQIKLSCSNCAHLEECWHVQAVALPLLQDLA